MGSPARGLTGTAMSEQSQENPGTEQPISGAPAMQGGRLWGGGQVLVFSRRRQAGTRLQTISSADNHWLSQVSFQNHQQLTDEPTLLHSLP